jgi:hypothetical protein
VEILLKVSSAQMITDMIKRMLVRPGRLTEDQFLQRTKILAADHAANMIKAASLGGWDHKGDGAHGTDLVIKAILAASNVKVILVMARRALSSHSYVLARACEAFQVPKSVAKTPAVRWGYVARLLRFLSVGKTLARFQQLLIFMWHNMWGGKGSLQEKIQKAQWPAGLPLAPLNASKDDSPEGQEDAEVNLDDPAAWGELFEPQLEEGGGGGVGGGGGGGEGHKEGGGDEKGDVAPWHGLQTLRIRLAFLPVALAVFAVFAVLAVFVVFGGSRRGRGVPGGGTSAGEMADLSGL